MWFLEICNVHFRHTTCWASSGYILIYMHTPFVIGLHFSCYITVPQWHSPGDNVLDGDPASPPPHRKGTSAPHFLAHVSKQSPISATAELSYFLLMCLHPHFTHHIRKKIRKTNLHFTRLEICTSADPHFTDGHYKPILQFSQ